MYYNCSNPVYYKCSIAKIFLIFLWDLSHAFTCHKRLQKWVIEGRV